MERKKETHIHRDRLKENGLFGLSYAEIKCPELVVSYGCFSTSSTTSLNFSFSVCKMGMLTILSFPPIYNYAPNMHGFCLHKLKILTQSR